MEWLNKKLIDVDYIGFNCKLPDETINQVFEIMLERNYINTDIDYFRDVFRCKASKNRPILWLVLNQSSKKKGRGNQTALFEFLEMMLRTVSNKDLITAHHLFEDANGKFTNNALHRANKEKPSSVDYKNIIGNIIDKANN